MKLVAYSDISNLSESNLCFDNFPEKRIEYINSITDKKRKMQSYFVTKLLISLLKDLGMLNKLSCASMKNGKWIFTDEFDVCFSHSKNIVCVAITDCGECSVDVEKIDDKILKFKKLLSTDNQQMSVIDLTKLWTEKECDIKSTYLKVKSSIYVKDNNLQEYVLTYAFDSIDNVSVKQFDLSD